MRKELAKTLTELDDVEFRELRHALSIAAICKQIMMDYEITPERLCEKLRESKETLIALCNGSYPYDLHMIAKVDSVRMSLEMDKVGKDLEQIISFPKYKDQTTP